MLSSLCFQKAKQTSHAGSGRNESQLYHNVLKSQKRTSIDQALENKEVTVVLVIAAE